MSSNLMVAETVTATPTATSTAAAAAAKSSKNVAAIAAGVAVGIVLIAAVAGGSYMFMRSRKRRQIEEEHRSAAAVNSFIQKGKSPSSAGTSFTDSRLDPVVMANNRLSVGSIADNQDYSRRILKVCSSIILSSTTDSHIQVTNA